MRDLRIQETPIIISNGTQYSNWFVIERWAYFFGLLTGTLTPADIGIQVTLDGGTTPITVIDFATQTDAIILTSGTTNNKFVDIGDLIRSFSADYKVTREDNEWLARITSSVNQGADRTLYIIQRGN